MLYSFFWCGYSPASEIYVLTFWNTTGYSIFYSVGKKAYQHVCIIKVHKEKCYWKINDIFLWICNLGNPILTKFAVRLLQFCL